MSATHAYTLANVVAWQLTCNGSVVDGVNGTIAITFAAADRESCELLVVSELDTINAGDDVVALLTVRDAFGNLVNDSSYTVDFLFGGILAAGTYVGNGVYARTYAITTSGESEVEALISPYMLRAGDLQTVHVEPGDLSLTDSYVYTNVPGMGAGETVVPYLQLRDQFGNALLIGESTVEFKFAYPSGSLLGVDAGVFNATSLVFAGPSRVLSVGGTYSIRCFVDGAQAGSTLAFVVETPIMVPDECTVAASPSTVVAGNEVTFEFHLRDQFEQIILPDPGVAHEVLLYLGSSALLVAEYSDAISGWTASYTWEASGSIEVTANYDGQSIALPITVTVEADVIDMSTTVVSADVSVVAGTAFDVAMQPRDRFDNIITKIATVLQYGVQFAVDGIGTAAGVYDVDAQAFLTTLSTTTSGAYVVTCTVDATDVDASAPVKVLAGDMVLDSSQFTVSTTSLVAGESYDVVVKLHDQYMNVILDDTDYNVLVSARDVDYITVFDKRTGVFSASPGTTLVGTFSVFASVTGFGELSLVRSITVSSGPLSLSNCIFTVDTTEIMAGLDLTASLALFDSYNNELEDPEAYIMTVNFGDERNVNGTFNDELVRYDASYAFLGPGAFILTVYIDGERVSSVLSVTILPAVPDPSTCEAWVSSTSVVAGDTVRAYLELHDEYGNLVDVSTYPVWFSFGSVNVTAAYKSTYQRYEASYQLTSTGDYGVTAYIDDVADDAVSAGDSFSVSVAAGALHYDSCQFYYSAEGRTIVPPEPVYVTFALFDSYDNALYGLDYNVLLMFGGLPATQVFNETANRYEANVTYTEAGAYTTSALISGATVAAGVFEVVPAAFAADQSTFTLLSGAVRAGVPLNVRASLQDEFGNTLVSQTEPVEALFGESAVTMTWSEALGMYAASLTVSATSEFNVSASLNGTAIGAVFEAEVSPAALHMASCTYTTDVAAAAAGESVTATIQLHDEFGNVIPESRMVAYIRADGGDARYDAVYNETTAEFRAVYQVTAVGTKPGPRVPRRSSGE